MWVWNPYAVVALVAFFVGLAFAGFVYFIRPDRVQNRRLAIVLIFESLAWGSGAGFLFITTDLGTAWGFQALFQISLLVLPWVYLRFIATLQSPFVRWLQPRAVDMVLVLGALLSPLLYFQDRSRFITGFKATWYAPLDAVLGPWFMLPILATGLVTIFALFVAIHLVVRRPLGVNLDQARAYLWAFGIRDGIIFGIMVVVPFVAPLPPSGQWTDAIYVLGTPISTLLFVPIAAYGILRSQLFDIDVKIKLTLERSTLIAIFAVLAFVLSEVLENVFVGRFTDGQLILALVGAGALAFVFRKIPARLADLLMPHADDEDRLLVRRAEVYRSACEGAAVDGKLDARELAVLERLRGHLGLSADEAERIARDALPTPV